MGVVVGFIIGYMLGSKAGALDMDEISQAWDDIRNSEDAQALVSGGADIALQVLKRGLGILGQMTTKR